MMTKPTRISTLHRNSQGQRENIWAYGQRSLTNTDSKAKGDRKEKRLSPSDRRKGEQWQPLVQGKRQRKRKGEKGDEPWENGEREEETGKISKRRLVILGGLGLPLTGFVETAETSKTTRHRYLPLLYRFFPRHRISCRCRVVEGNDSPKTSVAVPSGPTGTAQRH